MSCLLRWMACSLAAINLMPTPRTACAAFFLPLGHLPDKPIYSGARDVSADGSVVVGFSGFVGWFGGNIAPFRWTRDSGMVELGDLPGGQGYPTGMSADGSVVIGDYLSANGAFRWTSETGGVEIGAGTEQIPFDTSAVSADGSVVVGTRYVESDGIVRPAFRWTAADGMVDIGDLPGGNINSSATDVSADGSVIVGWGSTTKANLLYTEAFRWTSDGGMVGLGNLHGGSYDSYAAAVSADGSVIVGWSQIHRAIGYQEAFRWTSAGGMVGLGDLPGGAFSSTAEDVSADGSIVVGWSESANGTEAFLWDADQGMRSLGDELIALGVDVSGWSLLDISAISADGTTIVGNGTNPLGQREAWLANITAVPEPASAATTGFLGAVLVWTMRRRPRLQTRDALILY